ncbi:MAG: heparinase II/III family protein [Coxiellaceae bacterium]|nr:heparinase II/III family protein [Coxiellaceae bacterium]
MSQIFWRMIKAIKKPSISFTVDRIIVLNPDNFIEPILHQTKFIEGNHIIFLNKALSLDCIWKNSQQESKLWQYHLHYFNGLLSCDKNTVFKMTELLQFWLIYYPPCTKMAWDPYPISIRIVNLIKYQFIYSNLSADLLKNIYLQARFLYETPEYHLLGNHLLENAKALVFSGFFFEGDEPRKWAQLGLHILHQEIPRQILDDGGFFELSPMYHALMQELMLDIYNLFQAYQIPFPALWGIKLQKMRFWLKAMTHPDGQLSFFNDSALYIAPTLFDLEGYAKRLHLPDVESSLEGITHLKESGYIRLQKNKWVAILDCAKIGPDYLPAHGHADTLSFELSLNGKRIIVNSGTSTYSDLKQRQWERSTAAHNTVEINNQNSSDTWSFFRVGKRAYPCQLKIQENEQYYTVVCGHTGYKKCNVMPIRQWIMTDHLFSIEDNIGVKNKGVVRFYLHPAFVFSEKIEGLSESAFYPEFGKMIPSNVIARQFYQTTKLTISFDKDCINDFRLNFS